jgi:ABC-type Fe3+-hydroxamate transport system substrate-binding protein
MAEYLPLHAPGAAFTRAASATITAGQLLEVTGSGTVGPAGAASTKCVGVAAFDAASGASVTVHAGGVQRLVVGTGGVTAGDIVAAGAAGTVVAIGAGVFGTKIGIALTTASATAVAEIQMDR